MTEAPNVADEKQLAELGIEKEKIIKIICLKYIKV
jgi:hypothetical protein